MNNNETLKQINLLTMSNNHYIMNNTKNYDLDETPKLLLSKKEFCLGKCIRKGVELSSSEKICLKECSEFTN